MISWHDEIVYDFSNPSTARIFTEDSLFFDIETTGFSPEKTCIYLIGCASRKGQLLALDQFFGETKDEEPLVLSAFIEHLAQFRTVITYNGAGFDIPYLEAKCAQYQLPNPFPNLKQLDLYQSVSKIKPLLKLENYKQKSIEDFLGIQREDRMNGGELISVYQNYERHPSPDAQHLLRLHNYEDVADMPRLLPILSYRFFFDGNFSFEAVQAREYRSYGSAEQPDGKELIFTLTAQEPFPRRVSCGYDDFYFTAHKSTASLRIRLFDGELKFFLEQPKDYYYLPQEDMAIHKSVASYVDKKYRRQATAATCYTRRRAIFLPQFGEIQGPVFRQKPRDKKSYFELTDDFMASEPQMNRYLSHVLQLLLRHPK